MPEGLLTLGHKGKDTHFFVLCFLAGVIVRSLSKIRPDDSGGEGASLLSAGEGAVGPLDYRISMASP